MEPRAGAEGNADWQSTLRTQCRTGVRWAAYGRQTSAPCRHIPEVGAVCGQAARTALCGLCIAICVPTAIRISSPSGQINIITQLGLVLSLEAHLCGDEIF